MKFPAFVSAFFSGCASFVVPVLALATVGSASADQFDHTFFGNFSGNYTMVSCDYAEYVAQDFARKLGAENVSVSCFGGVQPWGVSPLSIHLDYDGVDLSGPTRVERVTIDSTPWNSNCVYDTDLMRALLREFPNVKKTQSSDYCFTTSDRYSYGIDVRVSDGG